MKGVLWIIPNRGRVILTLDTMAAKQSLLSVLAQVPRKPQELRLFEQLLRSQIELEEQIAMMGEDNVYGKVQ